MSIYLPNQEEAANVQCNTFIQLLSPADRIEYDELKKKVGSPENRYNRNKRIQTFTEIIESIRQFCIKNDDDDWKRCLVCGICWIPHSTSTDLSPLSPSEVDDLNDNSFYGWTNNHDLAINTRQLRVLIAKSKSTINGALAKMGYESVPTKGSDAEDLISAIPFLNNHYTEIRQWTIRRRLPNSNAKKSTSKPKASSSVKTKNKENQKNIISENVSAELSPIELQHSQTVSLSSTESSSSPETNFDPNKYIELLMKSYKHINMARSNSNNNNNKNSNEINENCNSITLNSYYEITPPSLPISFSPGINELSTGIYSHSISSDSLLFTGCNDLPPSLNEEYRNLDLSLEFPSLQIKDSCLTDDYGFNMGISNNFGSKLDLNDYFSIGMLPTKRDDDKDLGLNSYSRYSLAL